MIATSRKVRKNARTKHKCPFPCCSAEVIHLPHHMRHRHQRGTKNASKVLNSFGLQKRHSTACSTKKPCKSMLCPVYGCSSVVKRLHNHLTDFHHFERRSEVYKEALQSQLLHEVTTISSESTPESSSSEDESYKSKKKKRVQKKRVQKKREQKRVSLTWCTQAVKKKQGKTSIENHPSTSKQEQSDIMFSGLDYVPEQQNNRSNSESSDDSKYDEESENETDNNQKIFIAKLHATAVDGKTSKNDELVLLIWSNRPMGSSLIGSQINSSWAKIFGKEAGCGGATAFRKAAVSDVHQNDKSQRELAGLMVHNKATADRYYLMQEKSVADVKTSKYLSKVMRSDTSALKSKDKTKDIDEPNMPSCSWEFEPEDTSGFLKKKR